MPVFTVWSPFDGEPIPAPNETERDLLLSQGYRAEPPDRAGWTEPPGGLAAGGVEIKPSTEGGPPSEEQADHGADEP